MHLHVIELTCGIGCKVCQVTQYRMCHACGLKHTAFPVTGLQSKTSKERQASTPDTGYCSVDGSASLMKLFEVQNLPGYRSESMTASLGGSETHLVGCHSCSCLQCKTRFELLVQ